MRWMISNLYSIIMNQCERSFLCALYFFLWLKFFFFKLTLTNGQCTGKVRGENWQWRVSLQAVNWKVIVLTNTGTSLPDITRDLHVELDALNPSCWHRQELLTERINKLSLPNWPIRHLASLSYWPIRPCTSLYYWPIRHSVSLPYWPVRP